MLYRDASNKGFKVGADAAVIDAEYSNCLLSLWEVEASVSLRGRFLVLAFSVPVVVLGAASGIVSIGVVAAVAMSIAVATSYQGNMS